MSRRPPITHVAIRFMGVTYSLPKPNRHHDVIRHIVELTGAKTVDSRCDDQGFLDESGRYLTRKQALLSAEYNKQLIKRPLAMHAGLFSEDVW